MMRQEYSGTLLQSEAIKILLNPEDAMALGHGIDSFCHQRRANRAICEGI
jgi:hypothetical protein